MTTLLDFSGQPMVHALGWTLLHFCWEGTAVAVVLWCMLQLFGGRSSQMRYAAACFALLSMVALPLITFARIVSAERQVGAVLTVPIVAIGPGMTLQLDTDGPAMPWPLRMIAALDHGMPWVLAMWFAGVVFFVARLNFGLLVARRLRFEGTEAPPVDLRGTFDALQHRLGIERAVKLLHSARVQVPTVIGWLRPVVLIPASCLTGLSTAQIEAIFCHELAHVRRHDYLVSVFQSVAEALLFYHPAVWWVSKQVRRERECCCDELAISVGGDVLAYARALSYLEERRASFPEFVLGANGGVLKMRIKRLLGCKENAAASQFAAFTILAAIVLVAGSYVVSAARAEAARAKSHPVQSIAKLHEEPIADSHSDAEIALVTEPMLIATPAQPMQEGDEQPSAIRGAHKTWLEQDVRWIVTDEERDAFLGLKNDEQRDMFIENFWQRRNPNPGAPDNEYRNEIYARIAYANEHFATTKPGWMSDRGHIYIAYGKPNDIDSHPTGGPSGYPFETWHYRYIPGIGDNVSLEFVDTCRCGEYHYTVDQPGAADYLHGRATLAAQVLAPPAVPPPPPPFDPNQPARVPSSMLTVVSKTDVAYPPIARAAHVQGTVVLHAIISKTGAVENVQVTSGPPMLTGSAIDAVKRWTYKPFAPNGEPLEVDTTIAVNFHMSDDGAFNVDMTDPDPIRVSGGTAAGMLISKVDPVYPSEAKAARVQGAVVLKATISKMGTIEQLEVVSGPPELTKAAMDAVNQWAYKPYLMNGEPVEVQTTITVNFSLGGSAAVQAAPAAVRIAGLPDKELYDRGVNAIGDGQYDIGRSLLQNLIATYPDSQFVMRAHLAIADSWYKQRYAASLAQAAREYRELIAHYPAAPEAAEVQKRLAEIEITLQKTRGQTSTPVPSAAPTIREIDYSGLNSVKITDVVERFKRENVGLSLETPYDTTRVARAVSVLKALLAEHAHPNATITLETKSIPPSAIGITFKVKEGPKAAAPTAQSSINVGQVRNVVLSGAPISGKPTLVPVSTSKPNESSQVPAASEPAGASEFDNEGNPVKKIGGAVSAPMVIYKVDPEMTPQARDQKFSGIVLLNLIVNSQGVPEKMHVLRGVGMGLDEKAVEAVGQYRFKPAKENGQPVSVELNIEVNFQIFDSPQVQGQAANQQPGTLNAAAPPKIRDGATAPIPIYTVNPEFSEEARKAKAGGVILVNLTVDKKGRPQHVHVLRGVGNGLDAKAVDAVKQYKFKPAMKNDKPVQEALNIEVNFQIF